MTTPPTPEQIARWKGLCSHWATTPHDLERGLREAATACEALIAERDQALARVKEYEDQFPIAFERAKKAEARLAACEIVEANYQEALGEAKKLKAQLDVAVVALEGMANPTHPIGAMYWEWACAALAKIKETP